MNRIRVRGDRQQGPDPNEKGLGANWSRILVSLALVFSAGAASGAGWQPYLEGAYSLIWGPPEHIRTSLDGVGRQVGESLADMAADRREEMRRDGDLKGLAQRGGWLPFRDLDYRHLATAEILLFHQTGLRERLDGAFWAIDRLADRLDDPLNAFWYHYILALDAIDRTDSDDFTEHLFGLWHQVVLAEEPVRRRLGITGIDPSAGLTGGLPHVYRVLARLMRTAVVDHQLTIDPLGVVLLGIEPIMRDGAYGGEPPAQVNEIESWVSRVVEGLRGARSDALGLDFAIAYLEGEEVRFRFEASWFDLTPAERERQFTASMQLYDLAFERAHTHHGRASAQAARLELVNLVLERTDPPENPLLETIPGEVSLRLLPSSRTLMVDLLEVQTPEEAGFPDENTYRTLSHELWRALMDSCLLTAEHYDDGQDIEAEEVQSLENSRARQALELYIEFFDRQTRDENPVTLPDDAYFGAVQALEMLARLHERISDFSASPEAERRAFDYWLRSLELYPIDHHRVLDLADRLRTANRLAIFSNQVLPTGERIRESPGLRNLALQAGPPISDLAEQMLSMVPEVYTLAPHSRRAFDEEGTSTVLEPSELIPLVNRLDRALPTDVELVRNPAHPMHGFLRRLYHEGERTLRDETADQDESTPVQARSAE